jgi:hypothetical protein
MKTTITRNGQVIDARRNFRIEQSCSNVPAARLRGMLEPSFPYVGLDVEHEAVAQGYASRERR